MVLTSLFSVNRWTRYSTRVTYERSLDGMPLLLAHLAKAFHWELKTWLEESQRGSAAISATVSGKSCCLRMSRILFTQLDLTGEDLCGTEVVECWGCIGKVLRCSAEWRRLSFSSSRCHSRDGCWEAIRITVVSWESLIFWRVLGRMGAGGKA